ncbi:MAG: GntR family transcriptional regulator [Elainellaceae cyanobacterium]
MVRTGTAQSQLPLHLTISEKLREQIFDGQYAPGEQLPSEHQLMEHFEVSRITVRRAIANLVSQGLAVAQRGRGVFVKEQQKVRRSLSNPLIFFDEDISRQGVMPSIRSLSFATVPVPADVRLKLKIVDAVEKIYCQRKIILTDQVPVALDITYIPLDIGNAFSKALQSSLIYPTLDQNGVSIERVETTLECTHATHRISEHLEIPLGAPLLVNRYTTYTTQNRPIICGETLSRGDRLSYSVVLTKHGTP